MRTVYVGTSEFAAAVLERLAASHHRPALVVTRPPRPRGRGQQLELPPVAEAAEAMEIEAIAPESINDEATRERIAVVDPEAVCVCAFGALIKDPLLSAFEMLNVHPSLLPRWRGAAPVERAIIAGDLETGVSIMRVTEGLDSGPVCLAAAEPIRPLDTYATLAARLQDMGGQLLVRALDDRPPFTEQDDGEVTYAEKIEAADRTLDPGRPAVELERVVRALHPHIGARVAIADGGFLRVLAAAALDRGPAAGRLAAADGRLVLGCALGGLELLAVQPPGGRPMDAAAYLRGHGPLVE
ncbi:MAG: methionyl-tRNA formyltransferase [Actinomycetota bacterium]|nr:methionyl-tRNA formyltransferase [Actinomycetota bacterium]